MLRWVLVITVVYLVTRKSSPYFRNKGLIKKAWNTLNSCNKRRLEMSFSKVQQASVTKAAVLPWRSISITQSLKKPISPADRLLSSRQPVSGADILCAQISLISFLLSDSVSLLDSALFSDPVLLFGSDLLLLRLELFGFVLIFNCATGGRSACLAASFRCLVSIAIKSALNFRQSEGNVRGSFSGSWPPSSDDCDSLAQHLCRFCLCTLMQN